MTTVKEITEPKRENEVVKTIQKVTELGNRNAQFIRNHKWILGVIEDCIDENRCLPSPTHISENTGLTRKTIYEHLKLVSYYTDEDESELIKIRRKRLLEKVYIEAIE